MRAQLACVVKLLVKGEAVEAVGHAGGRALPRRRHLLPQRRRHQVLPHVHLKRLGRVVELGGGGLPELGAAGPAGEGRALIGRAAGAGSDGRLGHGLDR